MARGRINGEQLKQAISVLAKQFTIDEMLHQILNKLTINQLQQIIREMLNTEMYGQPEEKEEQESEIDVTLTKQETEEYFTEEREVPKIKDLIVTGDIDTLANETNFKSITVNEFLGHIEDPYLKQTIEALAMSAIRERKDD